MSKCWYCNNELTSGDNPKHFGICNKCYDEMFKSGDTIISSLTNKIEELQNKLAKQLEWIENNKNKAKNCAIQMNNQAKEITRLKQSNKDLMRVIWNTKRERAKKGREICKANNYMIAKDKQIAELQKQLKEKDYEIETKKLINNLYKTTVSLRDNDFKDLVYENNSLQQKLKSQPAEIVEKIRNMCCIEDKAEDGTFVLGINEKELDKILKEYGEE